MRRGLKGITPFSYGLQGPLYISIHGGPSRHTISQLMCALGYAVCNLQLFFLLILYLGANRPLPAICRWSCPIPDGGMSQSWTLSVCLSINFSIINYYYDINFFVREIWNIDRSTLKFEKQLGKGNFGEVFSGTWNGSTRVAIKQIIPGITYICHSF